MWGGEGEFGQERNSRKGIARIAKKSISKEKTQDRGGGV